MESSAPLESRPAVWAGLERLRSLSRLVLVAIERGDDEAVSRLAAEAETIISSLSALPPTGSTAPEGLHEALEDIRTTNRRIIEGLTERAQATRDELSRVRETRRRLRSAGMPAAVTTSSRLDREG